MESRYKKAGVDVEAGYRAVSLMRGHVQSTFQAGVMSDVGGFAGLFSLAAFKHMEEPVLVSGTDGVGTKLKIAFLMDKHDTIGIDCVAMCVNDIVCCGAKPLFFLDYIACGKNYPEKIAEIVKGVAHGCRLSGASLMGGETAEMPGFYPEDEYDLAGFAVGVVDKNKIIDGLSIQEGDVLIGLASSGIHSNGYSLVRSLVRPSATNIHTYINNIGQSLGEGLLIPTKIYVEPILNLIEKINVKGLSHITGGGFIENIPRMFKQNVSARIQTNAWPILPIFNMIQSIGSVEPLDMFNTFNMGIGMVAVVAEEDCDDAIKILKESGEDAYHIGSIIKGEKEVILC